MSHRAAASQFPLGIHSPPTTARCPIQNPARSIHLSSYHLASSLLCPQPTSTFPIRPCTQEPELPTEETASCLTAVCLQQLRRRALPPDHRSSSPAPRSPLPLLPYFLFPTLKLSHCLVLGREPKEAQWTELGLEGSLPSPGERRIQPSRTSDSFHLDPVAAVAPSSAVASPRPGRPPPLPLQRAEAHS